MNFTENRRFCEFKTNVQRKMSKSHRKMKNTPVYLSQKIYRNL